MKVYDAADLERDLILARSEGFVRAATMMGASLGASEHSAETTYPLPGVAPQIVWCCEVPAAVVPPFNFDDGREE